MRGMLAAAAVVAVLAMLATGNAHLAGQQQTAGRGFACPVAGRTHFTDSWGAPRSGGRRHQGVDMFAARGTRLVAVTRSRVAREGWNTLGGWSVTLRDAKGTEFYYAHLQRRSPVRVGQRVRRGWLVGRVGNTGNAVSTPSHLHFERRPHGVAANPTGSVRRWCGAAPRTAAASRAASADIPPRYLQLYQQTGRRYRIPWSTLAGIGKVESDHGRDQSRGVHSGSNSAGACGPMQIGCVSGSAAGNSWAVYGRGSPYDPANAIPAAARYLLAHGAHRNLDQAIYGYNHAWWYVAKVKANARRYQKG